MKITKHLILYLFGIGVVMFFFIFLLTTNLIGNDVKEKCQLAQYKYGGDCVEALSRYLDDGSNDFHTRNSAIWALGQLGDKRALPTLEKYYTGEEKDREPLNEMISQYELKKAINLINSGFNLTSIFWRY